MSHLKDKLLGSEPKNYKEQKMTSFFTYYSVLQIVKEIVKDLHILLTHDNTHKLFFETFSVADFPNDNSSNDQQFCFVLPMLNKEEGSCKCLHFS